MPLSMPIRSHALLQAATLCAALSAWPGVPAAAQDAPVAAAAIPATVPPAGPAQAAETPAGDQSLTAWMRDPIRTLDPQLVGDAASDQAVRLLFEGLYRPGPDGQPLPAAAVGHTVSPDGLVWTFQLRPDAVWSDGAPVTAADFVAGFRRLADPALGSPGAWFTQAIGLANADAVVRGGAPTSDLGVAAVDDRTLRLTLTAPAPWLDKAVMRAWTFPVPAAQMRAAMVEGLEWTAPDRLVGNGPFTLTSRDPETGAALVPSPRWHGAAGVRLTGVTLETGGDPDAALARFDAGEIDLIAVPGPLFGDWAEDRPEAAAATPRACTNALVLNQSGTAPEALGNPDIRRALSLSIDRDAIVAALGGGQAPAWGWVPPQLAGFTAPGNPDADLTQEARMAEAQRLVAAAGYSPDAPLRLTLNYNTSPELEAVGQQIRAAWKPLGIELRLQNAPWEEHAATLKSGEFQMARMGWCADVNDAGGFLRYFRPDGANPGRFADAGYDRLTAEAARSPDPGPLQTQAAAILRDRLPVIPIFTYAAPMLVAPDLRGVARGDAMTGWSGQDIWRAAE